MTPDPGPRVAVVIPAYRASATLPRVLDALASQVTAPGCEVVLVDSTGDDVTRRLARWPWVRVVAPGSRTLPGPARNIGVRATNAEWIAFLDADSVPAAGWLAALLEEASPAVDAVGGSVCNGTPRSPIGTAGWLLEFSDVLPHRRAPLGHAAGCNLLVRRTTFEEVGGFAVDLSPGEDTILTVPIALSGRLAFAPNAAVDHLNRTRLTEFLHRQRRCGMAFGVVCERVPFPGARYALAPRSLLAGVARLVALGRRLGDRPTDAMPVLALLPVLGAGVLAWTVGLVTGR